MRFIVTIAGKNTVPIAKKLNDSHQNGQTVALAISVNLANTEHTPDVQNSRNTPSGSRTPSSRFTFTPNKVIPRHGMATLDEKNGKNDVSTRLSQLATRHKRGSSILNQPKDDKTDEIKTLNPETTSTQDTRNLSSTNLPNNDKTTETKILNSEVSKADLQTLAVHIWRCPDLYYMDSSPITLVELCNEYQLLEFVTNSEEKDPTAIKLEKATPVVALDHCQRFINWAKMELQSNEKLFLALHQAEQEKMQAVARIIMILPELFRQESSPLTLEQIGKDEYNVLLDFIAFYELIDTSIPTHEKLKKYSPKNVKLLHCNNFVTLIKDLRAAKNQELITAIDQEKMRAIVMRMIEWPELYDPRSIKLSLDEMISNPFLPEFVVTFEALDLTLSDADRLKPDSKNREKLEHCRRFIREVKNCLDNQDYINALSEFETELDGRESAQKVLGIDDENLTEGVKVVPQDNGNTNNSRNIQNKLPMTSANATLVQADKSKRANFSDTIAAKNAAASIIGTIPSPTKRKDTVKFLMTGMPPGASKDPTRRTTKEKFEAELAIQETSSVHHRATIPGGKIHSSPIQTGNLQPNKPAETPNHFPEMSLEQLQKNLAEEKAAAEKLRRKAKEARSQATEQNGNSANSTSTCADVFKCIVQ